MICQKEPLCSEESVQLGIHFRKKLARDCWGEGFILQSLTGPGYAFWKSTVK